MIYSRRRFWSGLNLAKGVSWCLVQLSPILGMVIHFISSRLRGLSSLYFHEISIKTTSLFFLKDRMLGLSALCYRDDRLLESFFLTKNYLFLCSLVLFYYNLFVASTPVGRIFYRSSLFQRLSTFLYCKWPLWTFFGYFNLISTLRNILPFFE